MYQDSVKFAQIDIDALKQATLDEVLVAIRKEMADFQENVIREHQQQIDETLQSIAKRAEESASEQIGIMHSRVGTMQQEAFAKLREEFEVEKDTMLNAATTEIKTAFSGQITEGQELLKENIEAILNKAIPGMESRLHAQLTTDLQQLLLNVKFVLPE
jgi:vacuolar-type H+-ATPase subunit H